MKYTFKQIKGYESHMKNLKKPKKMAYKYILFWMCAGWKGS